MPQPLIPLDSLPENRPAVPDRPCPVCGSRVDPLRAGAVLLFDDGFQFLCGPQCRQRYLEGERRPGAQQARIEADFSPKTDDLSLRRGKHWHFGDSTYPDWRDPMARTRWTGVGAVCCAVLAGFFGSSLPGAIVSAIFSGIAAGAALWASWPAVKDVGWLAWALGPTGAVVAAIGAAQAVSQGSGAWLGLEGAALAAAAMVARAWFDAEATVPVAEAVRYLRQQLPAITHVPAKEAMGPATVSMEEAPVDSVRMGDEVFALEGESVAVDGVVQSGEALVLLYPAAGAPVRRAAGAPLLAGSRVFQGAVRVLASRVGDKRALARPATFGSGAGRDAAPIAKAAEIVTRWGGLATIALALTVIAVTDSGGLAAQLCAAGAVLLAAPLLAVRRAAESPLVSASAAAAARGIVYRDASALDLAGRVAMAAMSPYGTLTEGKPQVVEVHSIQGRLPESIIALSAAAEQAAGADPIAAAIREYARLNRIEPAEVRRATYHAGRGVTALAPGGEFLLIGNRKLLLDEGVSVAAADAEAVGAEVRGRTAVFAALAGRVQAIFTLQDAVRPGARSAVQRMLDQGIEVVLLTGDQRVTVEKLASDLDIAHIKAGLSIEERAREVKLLRDAGGNVAAVGRYQEDAAMLEAADVGIALGAAGGMSSEPAITLASSDVRDAAAALWIARAARDGALRATSVAAVAFGLIVAAAAAGLIVPAIAALLAVAVDAYGVRAGARLLRRIDLRVPART